MKTILITGINGFLGSHLARFLDTFYTIIGLEYSTDNLFRITDYSFKVYSSNDGIEQIFIDNRIHAVIHAATIYRRENESINNLIQTNILLPINLLELANKYSCSAFINTDSFFNNSNSNYSYLPDYTLSKKHAIEWLTLLNGNCKLINMKIFHMYGPNDSPNKFIPSMIRRIKANEPVIELTPGEQIRDFIFIQDVVTAYYKVLHNLNTITKNQTSFEVGTGKESSIIYLLETMKRVLKSDSILNFGALSYRDNEIMNAKADVSDLLRLGWKPEYTIINGIKNSI